MTNIAATSYANVQEVHTTHVALDLTVDFARQRLSGTAELVLHRLVPGARVMVLDTRTLEIQTVETRNGNSQWRAAKFSLGPNDEVLGAPLRIDLPSAVDRVRVRYTTSPAASGLQ